MKYNYSVLPFLFSISAIIFLSGCSNTITNTTGGPVAQTYQAHSEREFVSNASLRAIPGGVLYLNLEHLNAPVDTLPDTGVLRGEDIIPYSYTQPVKQHFKLGDSSYFKAKLVNESTGLTLFEITPLSNTYTGIISPGNYKLYLTSLVTFGADTLGSQNIFVQMDRSSAAREGGYDRVSFDTTEYFTLLKTRVCIGCNLSGADLHGGDLRNITVDFSDLSFANMSRTNFANSSFKYANLSFTSTSYSNFKFGQFASANLKSSNMSHASIINADFTNANLSGIVLDSADCSHSDFTNSVVTQSLMNRTNFTSGNMFQTIMSNSVLTGANFNNAVLYQTNFSNSILLFANFCGSFKNGIISQGAIADTSTHCWP